MANEGNLKPFKKGEDPRRNVTGLNAGVKHRSTIARKWLDITVDDKNPLTGIAEKLSYEDIITLTKIKKAQYDEDTLAYKALMDSAYGAPKQEIDQTVTGHIAINIDSQDAKLGE
jgi:hypothetical protein